MDTETNWLSGAVGALLCGLVGLLLLTLIVQWAQMHNSPEMQSRYVSAGIPITLRLAH